MTAPLYPPVSRVLYLVSFRRGGGTTALEGARPYTLRPHAQARWRTAAGRA